MIQTKIKESLSKLHMKQEHKDVLLQTALQTQKRQKHTLRNAGCIAMALIVFLFLFPPTRALADEIISKLWYTFGETSQPQVSIVTFSDQIFKEQVTYEEITETIHLYGKHIYVPQQSMKEYTYTPSSSQANDRITSIVIESESKETNPIPYEFLMDQFTSNLTESQAQSISSSYETGQSMKYHNGFHFVLQIDLEEVHDYDSNPKGSNQEAYVSTNLNCNVMLERQLQEDGTLKTFVTWKKDDVSYEISGYLTYEEAKQLINTLQYI